MKTIRYSDSTEESENNCNNQSNKHHPKMMKKVMLGAIIIVAGILLLASNIGIIPEYLYHILFSWPMLLVAIGVINIANKDSWGVGFILICIGGFYLVPRIIPYPINISGMFWGGLLILAGILIITRGGHRHRHDKHHKYSSKLESGYIQMTNVFGGSKEILPPVEFRGGHIENVFGGCKLDLTRTTLAEGSNVLEVECVFGGIEIIVPPDWIIQLKVTTVFGGFTDKRQTIMNIDRTRELIVRGNAVFGGGEVKSF